MTNVITILKYNAVLCGDSHNVGPSGWAVSHLLSLFCIETNYVILKAIASLVKLELMTLLGILSKFRKCYFFKFCHRIINGFLMYPNLNGTI